MLAWCLKKCLSLIEICLILQLAILGQMVLMMGHGSLETNAKFWGFWECGNNGEQSKSKSLHDNQLVPSS